MDSNMKEHLINSKSYIKVGRALSVHSSECSNSNEEDILEQSYLISIFGDRTIAPQQHINHFDVNKSRESNGQFEQSERNYRTRKYGETSSCERSVSTNSNSVQDSLTSSCESSMIVESNDPNDEVWVDVEPWEKLDDEKSSNRNSVCRSENTCWEFIFLWITFFSLLFIVLIFSSMLPSDFGNFVAPCVRIVTGSTAQFYSLSETIWSPPRSYLNSHRYEGISSDTRTALEADVFYAEDNSSNTQNIIYEKTFDSNMEFPFDEVAFQFRGINIDTDFDERDYVEWKNRCNGRPPRHRVLHCNVQGICRKVFETKYKGPNFNDYEPCPLPLLSHLKSLLSEAAESVIKNYHHIDQDWNFYPPLDPIKAAMKRKSFFFKMPNYATTDKNGSSLKIHEITEFSGLSAPEADVISSHPHAAMISETHDVGNIFTSEDVAYDSSESVVHSSAESTSERKCAEQSKPGSCLICGFVSVILGLFIGVFVTSIDHKKLNVLFFWSDIGSKLRDGIYQQLTKYSLFWKSLTDEVYNILTNSWRSGCDRMTVIAPSDNNNNKKSSTCF